MLLMSRIDQVITVIVIAYYLLQCFAGYKLIKISIAISSFVTGFSLGLTLSSGHFDADSYIPAVIALGVGILLAFLGYRLYLVGVFILCGSLAASAVNLIPFPQESFYNVLHIILLIAAFVIVGILGVRFAKICIIAVTAVTGAINAVGLLKTPVPSLDQNQLIAVILIIVLAVFGILVQRATNRS